MPKNIDEKVVAMLEILSKNGELTGAKVFEIAKQTKLAPMVIADVLNARNWKVQECQLGCF
jgi:hypothetical protein